MKRTLAAIIMSLAATAAGASYYEDYTDAELMQEYIDDGAGYWLTAEGFDWGYKTQFDGITITVRSHYFGSSDDTSIWLDCSNTTQDEMDALAAKDHWKYLSLVAAQDWWFDQGDATDSYNYWKDRFEAHLDNSDLTPVQTMLHFLNPVNSDDFRNEAARACYSYHMGENGNGLPDYITIPGSNTYNSLVKGMMLIGKANKGY